MMDDIFLAGLDAYRTGDLAGAEAAFLRVLEARPNAAEALLNLGIVCYCREKWDDARAYWQQAIAANPAEEKAYLNLGNLFYRLGQTENAIFYWEIFCTLDRYHPDAHFNLGTAYESLFDFRNAFEHYTTFLAIVPQQSRARHLRNRMAYTERLAQHNARQAERFLRGRQWDLARQAYELCVFLHPMHYKVYKHYASILYRFGEYDKAARWYEKAYQESDESDLACLANLGVTYDKLSDTFGALWAYGTLAGKLGDTAPKKMLNRYRKLQDAAATEGLTAWMKQLKQQIETEQYAAAEVLAKRLLPVVSRAGQADYAAIVQHTLDFLAEYRHPAKRAARCAYEAAEAALSSGQTEQALTYYERVLKWDAEAPFATDATRKLRKIKQMPRESKPALPASVPPDESAA